MRIAFTLLLSIIFSNSYSQTIGGSWYGKADIIVGKSDNNYLTELIIKQKGDEIEGIFGYYFRDGYKSIFVRGNYNKANRQVEIKKIPLTYYRSASIDGVDCYMDFYGTLMISKVETTLKGIFTTDSKYKYTCPDLRVSFQLDESEKNQDSLIRNAVARKVWQPRAEDLIVSNAAPAVSTSNPDSLRMVEAPLMQLVEVFMKRQNVLAKEIEVESDSVRISFYDNGDIDADSISVFLNNRPIVVKQELTAAALNIYVKLDSTKAINEVSMYAENLGKYPPNTALMVVNDGKNRHEIYLSSSLTQNSAVRLRRKK